MVSELLSALVERVGVSRIRFFLVSFSFPKRYHSWYLFDIIKNKRFLVEASREFLGLRRRVVFCGYNFTFLTCIFVFKCVINGAKLESDNLRGPLRRLNTNVLMVWWLALAYQQYFIKHLINNLSNLCLPEGPGYTC